MQIILWGFSALELGDKPPYLDGGSENLEN